MLRGNLQAMLERFADAEASFRQAIAASGATPALQGNLGNALFEQERFAEALEAYERALAGRDAPELHAKRAQTLLRLGRLREAEQAWTEVLSRNPLSLEAIEQLLQIYMGMRRFDDLQATAEHGLAIAPDGAVFHIGRGMALGSRGHVEKALEAYRIAAQLARGRDEGLFHEACMQEAVGLFKLGRWREGWKWYLDRVDRTALRKQYPRLAADPAVIASAKEPLTLRVHCEQGIGDELLFLRFAPYVRARGHRLSLRTHDKLVALLGERHDLFASVGRSGQPDPLECDVELRTSDLALASGEEIAPPLPLMPDERRRRAIAERLRAFGPPPYIGVTWRAGLIGEEQKDWKGLFWMKNVPADAFGRALQPLRASVVYLQRKPDAAEIAAFVEALGRPALDMSAVNDDLHDALALLSLLDDYAGVSNTNMHLTAGLADKPARVLLQTPPEWRWISRDGTCPWFPGFLLYPQSPDRSWDEALRLLSRDLLKKQGVTV
jgi:hypothetical protein